MILFSQVQGQRVLTVAGAEQLGSVRRLMVDARQAVVAAAELENTAGHSATVLPWDNVASIGPDALMVESAAALRQPSGDEPPESHSLPGKLLLTDRGDSLGLLEDVEFDETTGAITHLRVPGHALPLDRFVAIGPDAAIVPADPAEPRGP